MFQQFGGRTCEKREMALTGILTLQLAACLSIVSKTFHSSFLHWWHRHVACQGPPLSLVGSIQRHVPFQNYSENLFLDYLLLFSMSGPWQSEAWRWLFVCRRKAGQLLAGVFCVLVWSRAFGSCCFSGTALVNTVPLPDYFWVRGWFCFCGYLPVLVGINKWGWSVLLPFAIGVASSIWWLLWSWSYVPRNLCVTPANDGRSRR